MLEKAGKQTRRCLQDGDPSQNSAKSKRAIKRINSKRLLILAQSPDLISIENMFNAVRVKLQERQLRKTSQKKAMISLK